MMAGKSLPSLFKGGVAMGILGQLARLFNPAPKPGKHQLWVYVRCNRCGEALRTRIDLLNHLSIEYGKSDKENTFICRKTVMGDASKTRCFQAIEITLSFDANRKLIGREVQGGEFIEEADYLASQPM
jgi:hypothetical protein